MVFREHLWAVCIHPLLSRVWKVDSHCQVCMASIYTGWTILLAYSLHCQLIRCWSYRCYFVSIFFSKQHVPSRSYAWWLQEAFRLFSFKNVLVLSPFFPPVKPERGVGLSCTSGDLVRQSLLPMSPECWRQGSAPPCLVLWGAWDQTWAS